MSVPDLQNKRILVVEDDDMSFLYLYQLLKLTNCIIQREEYGRDAIDTFRTGPGFDMILMDIRLPDMDGRQVTRILREMNRDIPIIAQTAARSPVERDLAIEAGCTEVILKPFTQEALMDVIGRFI